VALHGGQTELGTRPLAVRIVRVPGTEGVQLALEQGPNSGTSSILVQSVLSSGALSSVYSVHGLFSSHECNPPHRRHRLSRYTLGKPQPGSVVRLPRTQESKLLNP
jgi:hypothetical protein